MQTSAPFLTGAPANCSFALLDHHGHAVTDADYRGRFLLIYFGFTHCRVVCPRALARLSDALALIRDLAERVQPLSVSVDPARDTPEVMKSFLETRYPRFTGLTGSREQADAAKQTFRVFAERAADPDDPNGYAVPHSALSYLVGPDGKYIAHFADTLDRDELARRLRKLVEVHDRTGGFKAFPASALRQSASSRARDAD
jgi:protein SCO1